MFCRIFLSVLISETIFVASSDNGFLSTVTLGNNDTPAKHLTNANVNRQWPELNDEEDDRTTDVSFQKVANAQQTVVFEKILGRWVSLIKNKSKIQFPNLKANEQYSQSTNVLPRQAALRLLREGGFVDEPSHHLEQLSSKRNNDKLTPEHLVSRPRWMERQLDFLSNEIENVQFTNETQESILLKKENEKPTIALNKVTSDEEKKRSIFKTGSEDKEQLMPKQPISEPWIQQYVINNRNLPNSEGEKHQLSTTTENKLLRETDSINPSSQKTKVNTESTTATPESIFQNWGLLILNSSKNKLMEEEHDQLEIKFQKDKKQPEANSQTLIESAEVDDDRNKVLRQKVENWYDNLQFRRKFANSGVSPEIDNNLRLRRNLQSLFSALSQKSQLSELQRSHAVDYRKQSKLRRQLLSPYSMPQAVDYRRLLSFWRKELRRQLQIKWNRRPLVEISPGAFKSDIYVNPPDDLAKHMQKLLELKKKQEERNRDLNAKHEENAE